MMLVNLLLSWIDALYSTHPAILIIAFFVWVVLLRAMVLKIGESWLAITVFLLGFIAPLSLLFLQSSLGLGYLHENGIKYVGVSKNYLAIEDTYRTHSKGGKSYTHRRLYLIDTNTGDVLFRKVIKGKVYKLEWSGDKLLLKSGTESQYFSLAGKSKKAFAQQDLKNLPELKAGIYKQGYNTSTDQVWVIDKKGKKFFYNAQTLKREPEGVPKTNQAFFGKVRSVTALKYRFKKEKKRYDNRPYCPIYLQGYRSKIRKQLTLGSGKTTNAYFVYGSLLTCFPEQNLALINSFETTDRKNIKLTAVALGTGKVLWEQTQSKLKVTDIYSKREPRIRYVIPLNNREFVMLMGGYLLRMQANTGKVIWKKRL